MEIKLSIPKTPISTQHSYAHRAIAKNKMIRFMTKEAKAYKQLVIDEFNKKYGKETLPIFSEEELEVEVVLTFKDRRKRDWDNYHKLWCDALEELAYTNDTQIKKSTVSMNIGSDAKIEINIRNRIPL